MENKTGGSGGGVKGVGMGGYGGGVISLREEEKKGQEHVGGKIF